MQQGLGSLVWFVVVMAAIPLALWLLKRSGVGVGGFGTAVQTGAPRTVATLALSPQQRVVTVEVGQGEHRTWLVLGVSPQGISTLHTMPPAAAPCAATAAAAAAAVVPDTGFSTLLSRLRMSSHRVNSPHAQG